MIEIRSKDLSDQNIRKNTFKITTKLMSLLISSKPTNDKDGISDM